MIIESIIGLATGAIGIVTSAITGVVSAIGAAIATPTVATIGTALATTAVTAGAAYLTYKVGKHAVRGIRHLGRKASDKIAEISAKWDASDNETEHAKKKKRDGKRYKKLNFLNLNSEENETEKSLKKKRRKKIMEKIEQDAPNTARYAPVNGQAYMPGCPGGETQTAIMNSAFEDQEEVLEKLNVSDEEREELESKGLLIRRSVMAMLMMAHAQNLLGNNDKKITVTCTNGDEVTFSEKRMAKDSGLIAWVFDNIVDPNPRTLAAAGITDYELPSRRRNR